MYYSKKVNVSEAAHRRIEREAERLVLSHKDYVEATTAFFVGRQLDPRTYQPEATKQLLQQVVDRLFSHLVHQEKHLLKTLLEEAAKARILGEVSVNHLLRLRTEEPESYQRLQQQDQQYLSDRLQQVLDQLDQESKKTSP